MRIAVDISLYPLDADFVPPIKDFIERLNRQPGLSVETNAMSTQVAGEHDACSRRWPRKRKPRSRARARGVRDESAGRAAAVRRESEHTARIR